MEHRKKFLILGNQNAITYTEIFRLIKDNTLWLGVDNGGTKWFQVKDDYDIQTESRKKIVNGIKYFSMGSIMWFTNLDHGRRHQKLPLMTVDDNLKFSRNLKGKAAYERYDNYDAIEVPTFKEIPSDYDGMMGVPITFLDKYNPEQFEILGWTRGVDEFEAYQTKRYVNTKQIKPDGKVSNGGAGISFISGGGSEALSPSLRVRGTAAISSPAGSPNCSVLGLVNLEPVDQLTF